MDYKLVLEEQIRELQKVQDCNAKNQNTERMCMVADEIIKLVEVARRI